MSLNNSYSKPNRQSGASFGQYFQISGAWIRENLKRFWAIPAFGMLCYFFTFLFPLLIEDVPQTMHWYIGDISEFKNVGLVFYSVLFPIIASVALNRYLYNVGSVNAMHSLPVTKGRLWLSNLLSGLIMVWLPALITFAVLIVGYAHLGYTAALLASLGKLLLCSAFYLTLFNLAAMLTGNIPVHIIASGFIAALPAALLLMFSGFCYNMLFGFSMRGDWDGIFLTMFFPPIAAAINPSTFLSNGIEGLQWWYYAVVAVITVVFYFAGAFLYSRRKLERAGDSFAFTFAQIIFVSCATVAGAVILGALFWAIWGGAFPWNLGIPVGGVIAFIIAKMVGAKSLRIFTRRSAIHLGATFAVLLAILGIFEFDLFGYETRVPLPTEIDSVSVSSWNILPYNVLFEYNDGIQLTDPKTIEAVNEVHRAIAGLNKSERGDSRIVYYDGDMTVNFSLNYSFKNGKSLARSWYIQLSALSETDALRRIVMSAEFQAALKIDNWIGNAKINDLSIGNNGNDGRYYSNVTLSSTEYKSFLNALQADRDKIDWGSLVGKSLSPEMFYVYISLEAYSYEVTRHSYANIGVWEDYTNTVQWLKDHGYYDVLMSKTPPAEDTEYYDYYG